MRQEFARIAAAFSMLPNPLIANGVVVVNAGGTALTTSTAATLFAGFLTAPGPIGSVTPSTGKFTTLTAQQSVAFEKTVAVSGLMTVAGALTVGGGITGGTFGANGVPASGKITIPGSRSGATAAVLEALLQAMQTFGLIIDSTTA